jgi:N utilization substance protein B
LALRGLFAIDLTGQSPEGSLDALLAHEHPEPEVERYARELVLGTLSHRDGIDLLLERWSQSWTVARMAVVDRNLLRMAAYELLNHPDVPRKVVLNEAVEIAKRYGDQKSPAFVNAILDKIGRDESDSPPQTAGEAASAPAVHIEKES